MIKNYIKTFLRHFWKNRSYSLLNVLGLGIGIACAALIFLWVSDELTYNDYFSNRSRLYKVKDHQTYDGTTFTFDATPGPMAAGMKNEIPGIRNTSRMTWNQRSLFSLKEKSIYEQGVYVDSSFFSMFRLHFLNGSETRPFEQLHSLVISETMANKFFGTPDAVGKTLVMNNDQEYTVSGVIADLPGNVSFNFDWLASFEVYEKQNQWLTGWGNNGVITYAELQPNADETAINKQLYGYIGTKMPEAIANMAIYPMARWRLYDNFQNGKEIPGRIKYVRLFSLIAWIILIIACINFMNLATARSEKRAREVGVRKSLGSGRMRLILQFIAESLMMASISAIFAVVLVYLFLPAFNTLVEKELTVDILDPAHLGFLLAITIICGLIAGSYPAFYLSSFNPVRVLKGLNLKTGSVSAGFIRKGLVVLQFSISVILIISTVIIYQQTKYIKGRDLGYDKSRLVYMNLNGKLRDNFGIVKHDLQQAGIIENATLSRSTVLQLGSNTGDFEWQGKDPNKKILITVESVSPEYISTMGMHLKAGRDFYSDSKADSNNIIINSTLAKLMNQQEPVGSILSLGNDKYTIVGVVDDFVYNDMYASSTPLILYTDISSVNYMTFRIKPTRDLAAVLPLMEKTIKADNPGYPVEYKFVDQSFEKIFKAETLIGKLATVFAALAIIISCLGLFGLSAYTAERRIKEIGIRKVLGASTGGLVRLLSKNFLLLVLISCIISFPIAWLMMNNWLHDFQYRIHISWWAFVMSGVIAFLIALLTVSFQAIRAAVANPVKSLRTE